jgi:hypothetical protein
MATRRKIHFFGSNRQTFVARCMNTELCKVINMSMNNTIRRRAMFTNISLLHSVPSVLHARGTFLSFHSCL